MRTYHRPAASLAADAELADVDRTLEMKTIGKFDVDARDVSKKCGPVGANTIQWELDALCGNDLDANGFLIDYRHIDAWMAETFGGKRDVFPSCEIIARDAAAGLFRLFLDNGSRPICVSVTARAFGQNGITAHCRRPRPMSASTWDGE